MKAANFIAALLCTFCPLGVALLRADLTVIEQIDAAGQTTQATTEYQDGKTRTEVPPGPTMIMDAKTGETISLLAAQKRFVRAPAGVVKAAVESLQGASSSKTDLPAQLVATGRKETIAGFPAEEYRASSGSPKVTVWVTRAIPDYEAAIQDLAAAYRQGLLATMSQNFGLDLAHLPGFPVRKINEIAPGQTITATLVSVSTRHLAASEFEPPADYQALVTPELTPRAAVPELRSTGP